MKKITLLLVIIFTFLFSTTSWGDWTFVVETVYGNKFYYDKDRIRKSGKYLYFWELVDYLKPLQGALSVTSYTELDCSIFRFKNLKFMFFNKSMGEGKMTGDLFPKEDWNYPKPNTFLETMYNKICEEHQ